MLNSSFQRLRESIPMKIILNGKPAEIESGITLAALLENMKITPGMVACEVNQKIVRRKDYPVTPINAGDQIEILQMIGGG